MYVYKHIICVHVYASTFYTYISYRYRSFVCICVCVCVCVCAIYIVVQLLSCVWLFCDPMDSSSQDSSVFGISQARISEWVAISFFRGHSQPRDKNCAPWIVGAYLKCVNICFTLGMELILYIDHNYKSLNCFYSKSTHTYKFLKYNWKLTSKWHAILLYWFLG